MAHAEVTLAGSTASVGAARRFLAATLERWAAEDVAWTAGQALSELATNAVIHAGTPFTVDLAIGDDALRLAVRDGSRRAPRQRHYGLSATTGRGLALVASLAEDWGVEPLPDGKVVWCRLSLHPHDPAADLAAFLTGDELALLGRPRQG